MPERRSESQTPSRILALETCAMTDTLNITGCVLVTAQEAQEMDREIITILTEKPRLLRKQLGDSMSSEQHEA